MDKKFFKFYAIICGRSEMVKPLGELYYANMSFKEYIYGDNGEPIGIRVICDLGHGYGFDDGNKILDMFTDKEITFTHSYTDTSDGDFFDDFYTVKATLLRWQDAPEEYIRGVK